MPNINVGPVLSLAGSFVASLASGVMSSILGEAPLGTALGIACVALSFVAGYALCWFLSSGTTFLSILTPRRKNNQGKTVPDWRQFTDRQLEALELFYSSSGPTVYAGDDTDLDWLRRIGAIVQSNKQRPMDRHAHWQLAPVWRVAMTDDADGFGSEMASRRTEATMGIRVPR